MNGASIDIYRIRKAVALARVWFVEVTLTLSNLG